MSRDRIRPRPRAGTLPDQILALASRETDEHGRPRGATSSAELEAWCRDLACEATSPATEAQLVDLLALECEVVRALKTSGVLADGEPPITRDLVALLVRMRGGA